MRRASLPARLALLAIRGYQRWLSPIKGYACALRAATGGESCSAYGYRVLARRGLRGGLPLLRRRLDMCGQAHRHAASHVYGRLHHQRGVCDPGCDIGGCDPGCDFGGCDIAGCDVLDVASNCSPGCDPFDLWPSTRRKRGKPLATGESAELDALEARVKAAKQRSEEEPGP